MSKAIDLTAENRFLGFFVGNKSSGKTCAAASFRKDNSQWIEFLDFDGRIRGLLGAPWIDRTNITYDYFPPKERGMVERLNNKLETYMIAANVGQPLPHTLVVDSLTSECLSMIQQALPMTHSLNTTTDQKKSGKYLGTTRMAGPEDYGFEATVTYGIMAFLKSIPIPNVIVTAHWVDKFGKTDPDNPYADSVVIGKKLSVRDKIGVNVTIGFDHIFDFSKVNGKHFVEFRSDDASTSYAELPTGLVDITGKNLYETMMGYVRKEPLNVGK